MTCGLAAQGTFWGIGAMAFPSTSPKPTGYMFTGVEVSASQKIYSFSETDFTYTRGGALQTSTRSGLATYMRSFGQINLYVLANIGVAASATSTGTTAGLASSEGGIITFPLGAKQLSQFLGNIGIRYLKTTTSSETLIEIGIMHKVGK